MMNSTQWEVILSALAERISDLEFDVYFKKSRIEELEKKLAEAEKHTGKEQTT